MIQIFVRIYNKLTTIDVEENELILNVKTKIKERHGIKVDIQRLIFRGRELNNESSLDNEGVDELSTIYMDVKIPKYIY